MLQKRPRSPLLPRLYIALLLMATVPYSQPSFCNGALQWRFNKIEYCFVIIAFDSAPGEGNCGREVPLWVALCCSDTVLWEGVLRQRHSKFYLQLIFFFLRTVLVTPNISVMIRNSEAQKDMIKGVGIL